MHTKCKRHGVNSGYCYGVFGGYAFSLINCVSCYYGDVVDGMVSNVGENNIYCRKLIYIKSFY
jgi:hypothetical protein